MAPFSSLMLYPAGFTAVGNRNHLGLTGAENVFIRGSWEAAELPGRPENLEGLGALQLGTWPQIALQNNSSGVDASDWLRLGHMPMLWLQSRLGQCISGCSAPIWGWRKWRAGSASQDGKFPNLRKSSDRA